MFIDGLIAGSIGAFMVYPIDVIKTNVQNKIYKNGFDCFKNIWKFEGIKGFYKGCIPQLIGVTPEKAIKLYTYNLVAKDENEFKYHLLGGLCAGTAQVFITCPYEYIKINLQMNNKININLKNAFIGSSACFLRDIPFSAIYFPLYNYLKNNNFNIFLSGSLAGIPASFLCTPADVIKTRMQTYKYNSIIETTKNIYINEGFNAFWKGSGWRVIRSSPQFGITLFIFEKLNNFN